MRAAAVAKWVVAESGFVVAEVAVVMSAVAAGEFELGILGRPRTSGSAGRW